MERELPYRINNLELDFINRRTADGMKVEHIFWDGLAVNLCNGEHKMTVAVFEHNGKGDFVFKEIYARLKNKNVNWEDLKKIYEKARELIEKEYDKMYEKRLNA